MRKAIGFIFLAALAVAAKDKKDDLVKAPLPGAILTAKKVFISKGVGATAFTVKGGFDLAFDSFYSAMKSWGRYDLTDKPEDADLVLRVTYEVANGGTHVYSTTNTQTNRTTVHSRQIVNAQLNLVVTESHGTTELWSSSVEPGSAFMKKNQEKEMISAGEKLAANLRERVH